VSTRKKRHTRPIRIEGDVAYVTLTQGYEATIDAVDVPLVEGFNWRAQVNCNCRTVYASRYAGLNRCALLLHRAIMGDPDGMQVDHIDGNGLNNCRSNLRTATNHQNRLNSRRRRDNTSGFKGVSLRKTTNRWKAEITMNGKAHHLGYFDTREAAYAAYVNASTQHHGQFGRTA
jgi:hypothetical protein